MSHYFQFDPELELTEHTINENIFGQHFIFLTSNGLFSYTKFDYPSLLLIENTTLPIGEVLDLGCGYGLIGIILAKIHKINLTQSDINPLAVKYCKKNAALNSINSEVILSDGFQNIDKTFDAIYLNPPIHAGKSTCLRLYKESAIHLNPNGRLNLVIQKKHGAESTINDLKQIYSKCNILYKKKGIYVIECLL